MYAVAGVSGHTGAATALGLLKRGQKVRVLVRNEAQGEPWLRRHAEVAVVDLHDSAAVAKAVNGLSGAYLLLPPPPSNVDFLATQEALLGKLVAALKGSSLKSLVFLSAAGAQHAVGTGPLLALHRAEKALSQIVPSVTFLRAAFRLENWAPWLLSAMETNELPWFGHPPHKFAQVGAHDIGEAAAEALEQHPAGTRFIELRGKDLWSPDEVAEVVTSLLGQPIKAVERPLDAAKSEHERVGFSPATAALWAELSVGMSRGLLNFARPTQVLHGTTPLFDALKPLV